MKTCLQHVVKGKEYCALFISDKKNDFNVPHTPSFSQIPSYRLHQSVDVTFVEVMICIPPGSSLTLQALK